MLKVRKIRRPEPEPEDVELGDDDIIECTPAVSGTYRTPSTPRAAVAEEPQTKEQAQTVEEAEAQLAADLLPSLASKSIPDDDGPTGVSDLITDLAGLSDGSNTPRLRGAVEWSDLGEAEAWLVSMVTAGFTIEALLQMSPLGEEATMRVLAKLITSRTITLH
jgi:hypothetical protein